jgi:hypothetical protein
MLLVIALSTVLGVILVTIVVLVCIIVTVTQCPKKSIDQESPANENIETSTNICYGDALESNETLTRGQKERNSLHVYDDVFATGSQSDSLYENVDAKSGLPKVPKPTNLSTVESIAETCEWACLPLKGVTPLVSTVRPQGVSMKKSARSLNRARTFQYTSKSPVTQARFATLSVLLEAADYEMPTSHMRATAV